MGGPRPGSQSFRIGAGRFYDPDGTPVGAPFMMNSTTTEGVATPDVEAAPDGSFLVVWHRNTAPSAILARRFAGDGTPVGGEFRVDETAVSPHYPAVAVGPTGRFVVIWADQLGTPQDTIRGRRFASDGSPVGAQFEVTVLSAAESSSRPDVVYDGIGNFIVTWEVRPAAGVLTTDVRAQRFGGLLPVGIAVNDGGDGVLEVGDAFTLGTTWRNTVGAQQVFQGRSSAVTAPAGLTLTLSADASYTLEDGAAGPCAAPCFSGTLAGTRPAGHVDAHFREDILPEQQGQSQPWTLHVGDSFGDVPRTSPYYRFVETLLHTGVTAGCGGGAFCPGASTTREQMCVFVLAAAESQDYAPAPCTTPVFNDVPASSPFCPFIEEMVRRGVTAGCGGGNFCPALAVTREQMSIFVLRTLDPALIPPACTTPLFSDVPASSPFCRWIEEMARRGITSGCGGGKFCPGDPVTREQMAVFLTTAFGLLLYGP